MKLRKVVITISIFLLLVNITACKKSKTILQTHTINQTGEKSLDGIKDILIDAHYLDINLVKTDGVEIKYHLYGKVDLEVENSDEENKGINKFIDIKSYINEDKLFLKFDKQNSFQEHNNKNSLTLDIYIPANYINDISIISSSSSIKISNLKLNELEMECSSSNIEIENSILKEVEGILDSVILTATKLDTIKSIIEMTKGQINFNEYKGSVEIYSKEVDINLHYTEFKNKVDIRNGEGSINISLPESCRFALDARTNEGYVRCEFPIPKNEISSNEGLKGILKSEEYSIFAKNNKGNIRIKKLAE